MTSTSREYDDLLGACMVLELANLRERRHGRLGVASHLEACRRDLFRRAETLRVDAVRKGEPWTATRQERFIDDRTVTERVGMWSVDGKSRDLVVRREG